MKKILFLLLFTSAIYAQTSTGQEQSFPYGILNESAQTVINPNTLVTHGADGTYGKASVNNIPISIAVQDSLNKKINLPTGFLQGLQLSINADPTKFNIAAGYYVITDFTNLTQPVVKIINYAGATGLTPAYLATSNSTYIALDKNQNVISSASPFTDAQRRTLAIIGNVVHSNRTNINIVNEIKAPIVAVGNQLHDFMKAIGFLNESGNVYSANGANLQINKSVGDIFGMGINASDYLSPHKLTIPSQTALTFAYRFQNGTQLSDTQNINPNIYDVGGTSTATPSNKWTIQRINLFQSGLSRIQPGQTVYNSFNDAVVALPTQPFVTEQNIADNAVFRCYLIVQQGTTNLASAVVAGTALFVPVDKFGNVIGNGSVALTYANIVAALGFTPENVANKSGTLTASSTLYPNNNAVIAGLALKQNKFIINVKDYGATGNGTTDDTAAINSAFAALPAGGGILFFPNGIYHSVTGYTFTGDNISIVGGSMPRCANDLNSLTGGTILRGQVLIDGNNITVENIGIDFGITYSNTYRSGAGGNALVIHDSALASIKRNIKVNNVIGLIRIGDFTDVQAAFHAILIEGVQFGSANNIIGVGGWFGVVVKATDFLMSNITGRENDAASVYIKSNTYAPTSRLSVSNISVSNYVARGNIGVLVQASDAEMETVSLSNVDVSGGNIPIRVEAETTHPLVGFSLNGLVSRNTQGGMSIRGGVYSPTFNNCVVYNPVGDGFIIGQNSVGQNSVDLIASNIRIVPTATTVDAIKVTNVNTKVVFNNVNVSIEDGKTLIAGSVINLQDDSDITNYVGILKRNNVLSDIYRYKGGGITTSLSDISTTANSRTDFANHTISLASGYLASDAPYLQSYNNVNNTSNVLNLNPFGGNVALGGTIAATNFTGSATLTGTPTAPTATPGTNTTQIATMAALQVVARPYKVYTALLSQTGTNAPTATVLENTLGTVVWTRSNTGQYVGTLTGAFTDQKTIIFVNRSNPAATAFDTNMAANVININTVGYTTFSNSAYVDGQTNSASIEIRVYN